MSPFRYFTVFFIFLLSCFEAFSQASVDNPYDTDGDGLIEVHTIEQLNVIRHDCDGDGEIDDLTSDDPSVDGSQAAAYVAAFHGFCPPDDVSYVGYELAASLDFAGTRWALNATTDGIPDAVAEGWEPIGNSRLQYTAIFEGNEHTITGLCINRPTTANVGFFGATGADAIIRNVFLEEVYVSGRDNVGGLVGFNFGDITSSYATGSVDGDNSHVGGLVGSNGGSGAITSSYATGSVDSVNSYVGGLVGRHDGSITSSYATGTVVGNNNVGGLVGGNLSDSSITSSYATGTVMGATWVGGLVGGNLSDSSITSSYATGDVTGDTRVGGLVGLNASSVTSSYATGTVDGLATGETLSGGLVGDNDGSITFSYATGSVDGDNSHVGGLVGRNNGSITFSYAMGSVTGNSRVGGLVGYNFNANITSSYATGAVTGTGNSVGGLVGAKTSSTNTITSSYYSSAAVVTQGGDPVPPNDVCPFGSGVGKRPHCRCSRHF